MELRQLRFFVTLAEELHFRRAAERAHIAQPAFSEQIRRLEVELGVRLFDRTSHYVRLTDAGRLFLGEVRPVLAQVERATVVAARAGKGMLGSLRVGFTGGAADALAPLVLRAFAAKHPEVEVDLREYAFSDPSAGLAAREVDLAFLRSPVPGQHELAVEPLGEEPRVAIMPCDHRLAGAGQLTLEDLRGEAFVVGPRATGLGEVPARGPTANTMEEWLSMISAGRGLSLVPASAQHFHNRPGLCFVPITGVAAARAVLARRAEDDAPTIRAFVATAVQVARRARAGALVPAIA